jgi:uncharacterized protein YdeI (YjbR/CyaY-like superfamily)
MSGRTEPKVVEVRDRAGWRRWLLRHHEQTTGIWLVIHKKGSTSGSLAYGEAVEEALCFGWIDSKPNMLDDARYKLWMAPRKPKGPWSALNKRRVEALTAGGMMSAAGLEVVERAKANGSWDALQHSDTLTVPVDLARAFKASPEAKRKFDAFPPSSRRAILEWIQAAKRPETRVRRVEETVRLAAENIRANHWRQ